MEAFVPGIVAPAETGSVLWFVFVGDRLVVRAVGEAAVLPQPHELGLDPAALEPHYLGELGGLHCFALELASEPEGLEAEGLRGLWGRLDDPLYGVAGRARQILEWDRTHRFCGVCGSPTERSASERARVCPACGHHAYPRLSPAVITLVHDGPRMLLARHRRLPQPVYTTIAGFVEPGESLEECVAREIREEVGVEVREVTYFGSQPWPFPHQLMIGFTAAYAGGEIRVDDEEILDAGWYTKDDLPLLPPPLSIARRLVEWGIATL